jgi:hypothetical protein
MAFLGVASMPGLTARELYASHLLSGRPYPISSGAIAPGVVAPERPDTVRVFRARVPDALSACQVVPRSLARKQKRRSGAGTVRWVR